MNRIAPALLVTLLALTACAAGGAAPSPSSSGAPPSAAPSDGAEGSGGEGIEHPTGSEAVLVVDSVGGFVPVDFTVTQLPSLVILGDGRVIVQGMQTLEFPGAALPPLLVRTLTEDGLQEVLETIEDTNLFVEDIELRGMQNMVTDAADTRFRLHAAGREVTVQVYALDMLAPGMEPPPGVDAAELQAISTLQSLNQGLLALDSSLPAEAWATEDWQPYEPDAFRLYVRDVTDQPVDGGDMEPEIRDWPADDDPATFGEEVALFGDGTRCGVVEGEAAAAWLAELSAATQLTQWTTDGESRFSVRARPVLPHEERTCPEPDGAA